MQPPDALTRSTRHGLELGAQTAHAGLSDVTRDFKQSATQQSSDGVKASAALAPGAAWTADTAAALATTPAASDVSASRKRNRSLSVERDRDRDRRRNREMGRDREQDRGRGRDRDRDRDRGRDRDRDRDRDRERERDRDSLMKSSSATTELKSAPSAVATATLSLQQALALVKQEVMEDSVHDGDVGMSEEEGEVRE